MRSGRFISASLLTASILASFIVATSSAQETPATQAARGRGRGAGGPMFVSPQVQSDRHVTFRVAAPKAQSVSLNAGDIQGGGPRVLTKGDNGLWELTLGPIEPGTYRYVFNIDGVTTADSRNPISSQSNNTIWSVVHVPGSEFQDVNDVPHGAVASIYYHSSALGRTRRMHVYTPPGYESGQEKYPVFYLLHGAGDSDDSWTSVGTANFILDNLIASGKAKPMIVVMPAGHTTTTQGPGRGRGRGGPQRDEFSEDFVNDIMPYVEKNYRTIADRSHRAIAGLSMGGGQTLNIGFSHLDQFSYIGVFSSGIFSLGRGRGGAGAPTESWEQQHLQMLDNAELKKDLKLVWFSTGKEDRLMDTTKATVELLKKHGFNPVFEESPLGHVWINWRNYLGIFAPQLFR